jgi:hypothetical protein
MARNALLNPAPSSFAPYCLSWLSFIRISSPTGFSSASAFVTRGLIGGTNEDGNHATQAPGHAVRVSDTSRHIA